MKSGIVITMLMVFFLSNITAQENNPQLHDMKFSYEIKSEFNAGQLSESRAAYYSTYIGKYKEALEYYSLPLEWGMDSMSIEDKTTFAQFKPAKAIDHIRDRLKDEQLVVISEAHQMPQHRVFTTELLSDLYDNGFRHLGIETLTPSYGDSTKHLMDVALEERGYPLNSPMTGFYTREVQMSNMIREAIRLGFKIFAYEKTDRKSERDLQQANNIQRYMNAYPDEKIVIHCGWYHAIESNYPKRKTDNYMAYHLKMKTGVDPLTIYQDALSERIEGEHSPYYSMINSKEVSVLVNMEGEVFNGVSKEEHFDIFIYHPPTEYIKERANWLANRTEVQFVEISDNFVANSLYPIIIEAFPVNENFSVAVDVIEKESKDDESELLLLPGNYTIRITNKLREVKEFEITVEAK